MAQYLDKFKDKVKKRQVEQVLKLLNKQKNSGEIRSIEEFTTRLDTLVRDLTQTVLKPSLSLYLAKEDETTDSETFNFMLDRIEDDLSAVFEECNNIDEVQKSHQAIVRDVLFKNLKYSIAELEAKVSVMEFVNSSGLGLKDAIFSTFRESKEERVNRTDDSSLFLDPRSKKIIEQDAFIELIGERLTLKPVASSYADISSVRQIFDSESPQSSVPIESSLAPLSNILDSTPGTYWAQGTLFLERQVEKKTKLEFTLSSLQKVDLVEIEPFVKQGIYLESIYYLDSNNVFSLLVAPDLFITTTTSYRFRPISTRKIILVFRDETGYRTQFTYKNQSFKRSFLSQAFAQGPLGTFPSMSFISENFGELLGPKTGDILGIGFNVEKDKTSSFNGWSYQIGLDNVRFATAEYENQSIYVSKSLKVKDVGQVGLKVLESRPYSTDPNEAPTYTATTYDTSDTNFFHASIEYYVIRKDLDGLGKIISLQTFPILPVNTERVHHERLLLTERSSTTQILPDISSLQFFADEDTSDIKVYKNGELLSEAEWVNLTSLTEKTPDTGNPMVFKIKVIGPRVTDIFTVSYTPVTSNTSSLPKEIDVYTSGQLSIVDLIGDMSARSNPNQLISLDNVGIKADQIADTELYLKIILRSNISNLSITPAVEEYMLLSGSRNPSDFEDDI